MGLGRFPNSVSTVFAMDQTIQMSRQWIQNANGMLTFEYVFDLAHGVGETGLPSPAQPTLEWLWVTAGSLATGKVSKATVAAAELPVVRAS